MVEIRRDDRVYPSSVLVRVADFSETPGARFRRDGPFSGEEFREEFLEKHFENDELEYTVEVDLRGTEGYASSFLDEAFGGLVRKHSLKRVRKRLLFQCDGITGVAREIAKIMMDANDIRGFSGEYRWLSNFWRSSVCFDGLRFPTVENAYQAAKECTRQQRMAYMHVSPFRAKKMGRETKLRDDWENVKLGIMQDLVLQKFSNNEKLGEKLIATGHVNIVEENNWGDTYWGVCKGVGENHLGRIIMDVRESLVLKSLTNGGKG